MAQQENLRPRILIVDDSRIVRAMVGKRIKEVYDIREEVDGEEGWHTLVTDPSIRILISDLTMPRLDGYGLLERVRSSKIPRIRNLPVIIISGDEDESARIRARQLGANDFISKGMEATEMLAHLQVLDKANTVDRSDSERQTSVMGSVINDSDPVTGLPTKEVLLSYSSQIFIDAKKNAYPIAVMQLMLDNLRIISGRYGEKIATRVRSVIAEMLLSKMRKDDMIATLTDNRFIIFSPGTLRDASHTLARRLCETVSNAKINYHNVAIKLTASMGVMNTEIDEAENLEAGISLAEGRMCKAHADGGNKIVTEGHFLAGPPGLEEALALLEKGEAVKVEPHLESLLLRLIPLLKLCHQKLGGGVIDNIAKKSK